MSEGRCGEGVVSEGRCGEGVVSEGGGVGREVWRGSGE